MNVKQIIRKAQLEVDAIRTGNVESALWSAEELVDAANTALDSALRIMRLADSDLVSKSLRSSDGDLDFVTETYDPADFQITDGLTDYVLPPDFVRVVSILPVTDGYEEVAFRPARTMQRNFMEQRVIPSSDLGPVQNAEATYLYTIVGGRTLRIAPTPRSTFDIELTYQYRPAKLLNYSTGTVTVTYGSTSLRGNGTEWISSGLAVPSELVIGSTVTIDRHYPRILSFSDDTTATLAKPYAGSSVTLAAYQIAMVPTLPEEHHAWLAQMTAANLLRKVSPELATQAKADLEKQLAMEVQPELIIRQVQESMVTDPFEVPGQ